MVYKQLVVPELKMYRCLRCGKPMFVATGGDITLSNSTGSSYRSVEPSSQVYLEYECHRCHTRYNVLFQ